MTREEAMKLQVGKDTIYIVEPTLEEILKMYVAGVELESHSRANSQVRVTGYCKGMSARVYDPSEIWGTRIEALQKLAEIYTLRSDQNLGKRHAVCEKIAKLKGGRDET